MSRAKAGSELQSVLECYVSILHCKAVDAVGTEVGCQQFCAVRGEDCVMYMGSFLSHTVGTTPGECRHGASIPGNAVRAYLKFRHTSAAVIGGYYLVAHDGEMTRVVTLGGKPALAEMPCCRVEVECINTRIFAILSHCIDMAHVVGKCQI